VTAFQDPVRFERQKGRDGIAFNGLDAPYYEIPNRLGEAVPRESGLRTSSLRGIAHLTNIFAIESFMDELAKKRGIDPAAFRRDLVKTNPRATHIIDTVKRMADLGRKRDGSALGFGAPRSRWSQRSRSTGKPARCGFRKSGPRSIPASRSSPTTSSRRPKAASSTDWALPSPSASPSQTARCRSRTSTTITCPA
jgi:CO/xanthine dehydrogenase Mo-binding subunit